MAPAPDSDLKTIARRALLEIVSSGRLELIDQIVSPNYTYREPSSGESHGREAYREMVRLYRAAFPDMEIRINQQVAEGDTVVTRFTVTGTHRGEFNGIAPTGLRLSVESVLISRIVDGQIVDDFESFDATGVMEKLRAAAAGG